MGPILAYLLLVYYKSKWLEDCPQQFKPQFYGRNVDNIFVIFKKKDNIKKFLRYIAIVILNSPAKKKRPTKYCFSTFPSVEIIAHWKHLSSLNLHLVASTLILIVSNKQNIKEICFTGCYTEHKTFVPAIFKVMKKLIRWSLGWKISLVFYWQLYS